jgi:hypothetical protein
LEEKMRGNGVVTTTKILVKRSKKPVYLKNEKNKKIKLFF